MEQHGGEGGPLLGPGVIEMAVNTGNKICRRYLIHQQSNSVVQLVLKMLYL